MFTERPCIILFLFPILFSAVVTIILLLLAGCSDNNTPVTKGASDSGGAGTVVEVEYDGKTYFIWHHYGYESESAVLLTVRSK